MQHWKGRIIALICVVAWGVSNRRSQVALVLLLVFLHCYIIISQ
ncbi:hypothetical protein O9992_06785 [Vibrio lentus]|nr:hypothetical protein [Vibrio lentus]